MDTVYKEHYKGCNIEIVPDIDPDNPREWDNLGTIACWHSQYSLGDEQPRINPREWLEEHINDLYLPIYMYDHSGYSISTTREHPYNDPWDSMWIGFIYITKQNAVKRWGKKLCTKAVEEKALNHLKEEITMYDNYLRGNVYGFVIRDGEDEIIESMFGYHLNIGGGLEGCVKEARAQVEYIIKDDYEGLPYIKLVDDELVNTLDKG